LNEVEPEPSRVSHISQALPENFTIIIPVRLAVVFNLAVSIQPAPARDFWPLESRHCHFPNPNPNHKS